MTPTERPEWLTPVDGQLVRYDAVAPTLRDGEWHLHALHRADGVHSSLVAVRFPDGRLRYVDLDGDVLALQLVTALLPLMVCCRLAELAYDYGLEKAQAIDWSTRTH